MRRPQGFTLIELLVVLAIVAVSVSAVVLSMPDAGAGRLQEEGERLAAWLETARARSRAQGVPVFWQPTNSGFVFSGLGTDGQAPPSQWLYPQTQVQPLTEPLVLGPEPILPSQQVVLGLDGEWRLRVWTDGVRPFRVEGRP